MQRSAAVMQSGADELSFLLAACGEDRPCSLSQGLITCDSWPPPTAGNG